MIHSTFKGSLSLLLLLTLTALSSGCVLTATHGNGVAATETRAIDGVDRVVLPGGSFDRVDLYVCACDKVVLHGDDNLLGLVETEQSGDTLTVDVDGWVITSTPLIAEIYVRDLSHVEISGSSNVRILDLSGGALEVESSGSSDIKFKGELDQLTIDTSGSSDVDIEELAAEALVLHTSGSSDMKLVGAVSTLEIDTSGSSDIDAMQLTAQRARVTISGSSDVDLCVTDSLDVNVSGSGDVTYACDPAHVTRDVSGSGDVRRR